MGFTEITISNGGAEVMLDIESDGRVIDIYTFAHDTPLVYYNSKDDEISYTDKWKVEGNELFVHCPKRSIPSALKRLAKDDDAFLLTSESEEEGGTELLWKVKKRYSLPDGAFQ